MSATTLFTPSEIVFLNSHAFVDHRLNGLAPYKGQRKINGKELVNCFLMAAFIALVKSETISLTTDDKGQLLAVRTATNNKWPVLTLETRLLPAEKIPVATLVDQWVGARSILTYQQAIENIKVLLTLRKHLKVRESFGGSYIYERIEEHDDGSDQIDIIKQQLADFEQQESETYKQLKAAIDDGLNKSSLKITGDEIYDPWLKESKDWLKNVHNIDVNKREIRQQLIAGGIIWTCVIIVMISVLISEGMTSTVTKNGFFFILSMSIIALNLYLKWRYFTPEKTRSAFFAELVLWTGLFNVLWALFFSFPLGYIGIASLFLLSTLIKLLQKNANQAITQTVTKKHKPSSVQPLSLATDSPDVVVQPTKEVVQQRSLKADVDALKIEVLKKVDLDNISNESKERVAAIQLRNCKINIVYIKSTLTFVVALGLLSLIAWYFDCTNNVGKKYFAETDQLFPGEEYFPLGTLMFTGALIFALSVYLFNVNRYFVMIKDNVSYRAQFDSTIWSATDRMNPFDQWKKSGIFVSYRPWIIFTIGIICTKVSLDWINSFASAVPTYRWVFILLAFLIPAIYLFFIYWKSRQVKKQYPVYPPFNLLSLRVFGESPLLQYLGMIKEWRWLGLTYLLDGPDTAGSKQSDLGNYLRGQLHDSIVEHEEELYAELKGFNVRADKDLKYEIHSMQCNDASWQIALHTLLDMADVVIMDLSGFSPENKGCAYELEALINTLPFEQFILAINEKTDLPYLQHVLQEAWSNRKDSSPNHQLKIPAIKLYYIDFDPSRQSNESEVVWRERLTNRISSDALVCQLYDAALNSLSEKDRKLYEGQKVDNWEDQPKIIYIGLALLLIKCAISIFYSITTLYPAERVDQSGTPIEATE